MKSMSHITWWYSFKLNTLKFKSHNSAEFTDFFFKFLPSATLKETRKLMSQIFKPGHYGLEFISNQPSQSSSNQGILFVFMKSSLYIMFTTDCKTHWIQFEILGSAKFCIWQVWILHNFLGNILHLGNATICIIFWSKFFGYIWHAWQVQKSAKFCVPKFYACQMQISSQKIKI